MLPRMMDPGRDGSHQYVIGTAGHVDHGKSTLVLGLTGTDPDRWQEEKERGLTIDLGFARLRLPSGAEASIVDVPGHERFIKNMLAGVGGIDLALLVIAADEGVMPQTREHLAIIDLLAITAGVVAVTRSDLADEEMLALAMEEARLVIEGTSLEGSAVVPCSGVTRKGLDDLVQAIEAALDRAEPRRDIGRPRLPVDRAFAMPGFGAVVTGTLIDGQLAVGQEVEVLPPGHPARIRGLEHHGEKVEVARPGRRTAVNLAGISVDRIERGMVVVPKGQAKAVSVIDGRVRAVPYLGRSVRHNLPVTLHTGSAEVAGRLLLLDCDGLKPGETAWAQIRLSSPVVAVPGDHFILRDPNDTVAGGEVVDLDSPRHRRFHAPTLEALARRQEGRADERVLAALGRGGPADGKAVIDASGIGEEAGEAAIAGLAAEGRIVLLDGDRPGRRFLCSAVRLADLRAQLSSTLEDHHRRLPLRGGMSREELRGRLGLEPAAFDALLRYLAAAGDIADGPLVAKTGHEPALTTEQRQQADAFIQSLLAAPYAPLPSHDLPQELVSFLAAKGEVVDAGGGVVFARSAYDSAVTAIKHRLADDGELSLADVRDMLGTSRKYAQALLEHLDAQRITRRTGDVRTIYGLDAERDSRAPST
jgi:selenocysteine-specific elongation factor